MEILSSAPQRRRAAQARLRRASRFLAAGNFTAAREEIEAACRIDPDDETARALRGWVLDGSGSPQSGARAAGEAADPRSERVAGGPSDPGSAGERGSRSERRAVPGAFHAQMRDWNRFEAQMRRRQAASYERIARQSIEAGREDDAARAIAEIERLHPGDPALSSLRAALRLAEPVGFRSAPAPPTGRAAAGTRPSWRSPGRTLAVVMVLICVALSAGAGHAVVRLGGLDTLRSLTRPLQLSDETWFRWRVPGLGQPPAGSRAAGAWLDAADRPVAVTFERREVPVVREPASSPADPTAAEDRSPSVPQVARREPVRTPEARARPERRGTDVNTPAAERQARAVEPEVPESEPVAAVAFLPPLPVSTDVPSGRDATSLEAGSTEPASGALVEAGPPAAPAPVSVQPDVAGIEQTLRRYAAAYRQLDARAAKAVWPSVDERALARAFDGLAAQDLVLERCRFDVAEQTATASCSGRASYVPRVGSRGLREESREWSFTLSKVEDGWKIAEAATRTQ